MCPFQDSRISSNIIYSFDSWALADHGIENGLSHPSEWKTHEWCSKTVSVN